MKSGPRTRILLADDHYVVRIGLRGIFEDEEDLEIVAEAEDGDQAVEQFRRAKPDLVLMDLRMPGLNGVEATQAIRRENPRAIVLMLTTYDGDEDIQRALAAGASGFLLKNMPHDELLSAVRAAAAGQKILPAAVLDRMNEHGGRVQLTNRELEVLCLIRKGLSNREIGEILGFSENTAKAHVKHIMAKLDVSDRTEAVTSALQRGILHLE